MIIIYADSYNIAKRIQGGYPVLKGECYYRIASWGVSLVERQSPVFVHGIDEPLEWKQKCGAIDRQRNL